MQKRLQGNSVLNMSLFKYMHSGREMYVAVMLGTVIRSIPVIISALLAWKRRIRCGIRARQRRPKQAIKLSTALASYVAAQFAIIHHLRAACYREPHFSAAFGRNKTADPFRKENVNCLNNLGLIRRQFATRSFCNQSMKHEELLLLPLSLFS